jgi:hypothetical protein
VLQLIAQAILHSSATVAKTPWATGFCHGEPHYQSRFPIQQLPHGTHRCFAENNRHSLASPMKSQKPPHREDLRAVAAAGVVAGLQLLLVVLDKSGGWAIGGMSRCWMLHDRVPGLALCVPLLPLNKPPAGILIPCTHRTCLTPAKWWKFPGASGQESGELEHRAV